MHEERLKGVVEALRVTPDNEFHMWEWGYQDECGTVGCAVGSYCLRNPYLPIKLVKSHTNDGLTIEFNGSTSWAAVEEYFDLNTDESVYLFVHTSYPEGATREQVISRIEQFLKDGVVQEEMIGPARFEE